MLQLMVRPMEADDAGAVAGLAGQLGYTRTEGEVRAWLSCRAKAGRAQAAFVGCLAGEVVGWVEVTIVEPVQVPAHGLIGGLVVRDGCRGMRIGRRLREFAEAWVWAQGANEVVVTSRSTRLEAHRFYLRDGYRRVKTSEVFAKGRPEGAGSDL